MRFRKSITIYSIDWRKNVYKVLERAVSRKLLVWITAAGFTYAGTVDSADFVILSAIYIGSQGVIDAVSKLKAA